MGRDCLVGWFGSSKEEAIAVHDRSRWAFGYLYSLVIRLVSIFKLEFVFSLYTKSPDYKYVRIR